MTWNELAIELMKFIQKDFYGNPARTNIVQGVLIGLYDMIIVTEKGKKDIKIYIEHPPKLALGIYNEVNHTPAEGEDPLIGIPVHINSTFPVAFIRDFIIGVKIKEKYESIQRILIDALLGNDSRKEKCDVDL